jgi:hypothetical protein
MPDHPPAAGPTNQSKQAADLKKSWLGYAIVVGTLSLFVGGGIVMFSEKRPTSAMKPLESEAPFVSGQVELLPYDCESRLKESLRNPETYRNSGNPITSKDTGSEKTISWSYQAMNGFGIDYTAIATCSVSKDNGGIVSISFLDEP